jgi:phage major head subunit gpT-like protein
VANSFAPAADPGPAWYLLDTSRSLKPLIYQERTKPEFTSMTKVDDESVFTLDEYRYGVRARNNGGFGFWQMAVRSTKPLDQASFEEAYDAMRAFAADGGRPLNLKATLLVCPTNLRSAAKAVVGVAKLANGSDNPNHNLVEILDTAWLN